MHTLSLTFMTLALPLVVGSGGTAFAEVYRWKDSNGRVHFGDQPISTDPKEVTKVVVQSPNLAKAFKPDPAAPSSNSESGQAAPANLPTSNSANQGTKLNKGLAAASKDSCKARVAAYEASVACFATCAKPNGYGRGTNTAGCEYCSEQTMPHC